MEYHKLKDINADLGEGLTDDMLCMPWISSCNIACGAHAGSPEILRKALQAAIKYKVLIGMHPSYPDPENFGRVKMNISIPELSLSIENQLLAFIHIAKEMNAPIHHLKCHGALYQEVAYNPAMAQMFIELWKKLYVKCKIYLPAYSYLETLCVQEDIPFWREAFADRLYMADGKLVDRNKRGAVISDPVLVLQQALSLTTDSPLATFDGNPILVPCDTICFHSDQTGSLDILHFVIPELQKKLL